MCRKVPQPSPHKAPADSKKRVTVKPGSQMDKHAPSPPPPPKKETKQIKIVIDYLMSLN